MGPEAVRSHSAVAVRCHDRTVFISLNFFEKTSVLALTALCSAHALFFSSEYIDLWVAHASARFSFGKVGCASRFGARRASNSQEHVHALSI